jgi:biopolymer transport protein ExbD
VSGGKKKRREKPHHVEELNVVPLIDIMANLLFFLMVGMDMKEKSESGDKIELPPSISKQQEEGNVVKMSVSKDELQLEGVKQAVLKAGVLDKADLGKDGTITRLKQELEKRRKTIETSGLDLTLEKNKPVIFLLADRNLDYEVVESVMRTSGSAGFPRFRFGVLSH